MCINVRIGVIMRVYEKGSKKVGVSVSTCVCVCVCVCVRRERERETERERQKETEREKESKKVGKRARENGGATEQDSEIERDSSNNDYIYGFFLLFSFFFTRIQKNVLHLLWKRPCQF